MKSDELKTKETLQAFRDAMQLSIEFTRPQWDKFIRLYQLWHGRKPKQLNNTISKVMLNLFHQSVQDRMPKIIENVFGSDQLISLRADNPKVEFSRAANEYWLRDLLDDKVKIREGIHPTIQTMLIGGTAYRMPRVYYKDGKPQFTSSTLDFFQVIPAPGGGAINPTDAHTSEAVDWLFVVDEWSEDKILKNPKLDKDEVARMLSGKPGANAIEESEVTQYRNQYQAIGSVQYGGSSGWRDRMDRVNASMATKKRRIIHWYLRDRHVIVAEDAFVIYDGPPLLPDGQIPIAKYTITPDLTNFFGISYLEMLEDLLQAMIVNFNLRLDHLAGVMFPTTWIRQDIAQNFPKRDFVPRPYDVKFFPTTVRNVSEAVWYDRRPDVSSDSFMDEDRMKAMVQKIGGQTETTSSLNNVIGNKTATGVTSILNELSGRPNMESLVVENTGFRSECQLLMLLSAVHFNKRDGQSEFIRNPDDKAGFPFMEIDPDEVTNNFTVVTQGTRFLADRQIKFQQLLGMYPYWNQSPHWDQRELDRQAAELGGFLPDVDRAMLPAATPGVAAGAAEQAPGLGGLASSQDASGRQASVDNRTGPEPGTGNITPASLTA
jgi:hypothetical protein